MLRLILGVLAVVLLVVIGYFITRQIRTRDVSIRVSPTPTPSKREVVGSRATTPTPKVSPKGPVTGNSNTISLNGTVSEIVGISDYKNSIITRVESTSIYITQDTKIVDSNNQFVSKSYIQPGTYLEITGIAYKDGIEATNVKLPNNLNLPNTGGYRGE